MKRRLAHDQHVFLLSIWAGLPAVVTAVILLCVYVADAKVRWTVGALVVLVWLFASLTLAEPFSLGESFASKPRVPARLDDRNKDIDG